MFEVQARTLPHALAGKDILGKARTGCGKTLSFAIPLVQKLNQTPATGRARGLVVLPTRELCNQVADVLESIAPLLKISRLVGGGSRFAQFTSLRNVDVVVGTPGRLMEFHESGDFSLDHIQFFALDEADMLVAHEFMKQLSGLIKQLPVKRQTMLFSATLPGNVMELSDKYMNNPEVIDITTGKRRVPSSIEHISIAIEPGREVATILHLLEIRKPRRTLAFVQKKAGADQLSAYLRDCGIACAALHSGKSSAMRNATVKQFKMGSFELLVATDIAARGIDIPDIDLVLHVGTPPASQGIDAYIHRAGRTGRSGATGTSILLHYSDDVYLEDLSKIVEILPEDPPAYNPRHSASQPWQGYVRLNSLIPGNDSRRKPKVLW